MGHERDKDHPDGYRTNANLYTLGGAHTIKPLYMVNHMYDIRSNPDYMTGTFHGSGDLVNGRPDTDSRYDRIPQREAKLVVQPFPRSTASDKLRARRFRNNVRFEENYKIKVSPIKDLDHTWINNYIQALDGKWILSKDDSRFHGNLINWGRNN